jgi:hypothetical protein
MNKTIKFGYDGLGRYTLVKLNCVLTRHNLDALEITYKEWLSFMPGFKGRIRIEGVLPLESSLQFRLDLELALLRSKRDILDEKIADATSVVLGLNRTIPNLNDVNTY